MLQTFQYGVRPDGNPVTETTTYLPCPPDHPLAETLPGETGTWVKLAVGNSLTAVSARKVSKAEHDQAKIDLEAAIAEREAEREMEQERRKAEIEAKKDEVRKELRKLGLTDSTITAILQQVEG